MPRVIITLPAYRAARTLAQTVADIPTAVADRLILVDDASPDNTADLARELGIDVHVHPVNLGYGGNQKTCYVEALRSGADIVVLLHPDYQYEPKAVPLLIAPILAGDAEMTFGSRFAGLGDPIGGGMPLYRFVGNRMTTILENMMLGSRFTELHSGLRAYTRESLLGLPFLGYSDSFVFDSQLLIDAVTSGQRVVEVPIPTRYTKESSSISIDRSLAYIAGSLAYCARRVALRGRRGRVPAARRTTPMPPRAVRAAPAAAPTGEQPGCPACGAPLDHLRDASARGASGAQEPQSRRCAQCGLIVSTASVGHDAEAVGERTLEAIPAFVLDTAGGYFVPGDRLAAVGPQAVRVASVARDRGWQARVLEQWEKEASEVDTNDAAAPASQPPASSRTRQERLDVVLLLDLAGEMPELAAELRRARSLLHPEGLIVLAAPAAVGRGGSMLSPQPAPTRYALTAASVRALLDQTGLTFVEWISPFEVGVLAREVRRGVAPWHRLVGPATSADWPAGAPRLAVAVARP